MRGKKEKKLMNVSKNKLYIEIHPSMDKLKKCLVHTPLIHGGIHMC